MIGLGNPLMGDDGVGLVALERLSALSFTPAVQFVDGGTWGLALLPDFEGAGALLLLDAVQGDAAPGALTVMTGDEIPRFFSTKLSPHQIDVRELLALAALRGAVPARLMAVGIQPDVVEFGTDLSPTVLAFVDDMVAAAIGILDAWGHRCVQ